jgi:hypothetical protein
MDARQLSAIVPHASNLQEAYGMVDCTDAMGPEPCLSARWPLFTPPSTTNFFVAAGRTMSCLTTALAEYCCTDTGFGGSSPSPGPGGPSPSPNFLNNICAT